MIVSVPDILQTIPLGRFDRLFCRNAFLLGSPFESDMIEVTASGYFTEYEIKISREDFTADFRKKACGINKHAYLAGRESKTFGFFRKPIPRPKHFYFVAPEGRIPLDAIPEHCGFIEVYHGEFQNRTGFAKRVVKAAPKIAVPTKLDFDQLFNLAQKVGRR